MKPAALYSLENERWMSIRKAADAVAHQVIAEGLRRLGIAFRVTDHGVEIDAYSREHLRAFSDGAKSVAAALEARGIEASHAGGRASGIANLVTRRQKRVAPLPALHEKWIAKTLERGLPLFEAGDKRLERAPQQEIARMSADQALDVALDDAQACGHRLHADFAVLRAAVVASRYSTPHDAIAAEIERRLKVGELVHTPEGIVRREAAILIARAERAQQAISLRQSLRLDRSQNMLTQRLASPSLGLSAAEQASVLQVVRALADGAQASTSLFSSRFAAAAAAGELERSLRASGFRPLVVTSVASALASSARLTERHVLLLMPGALGAGPGTAALRRVAERAGAAILEFVCSPAQRLVSSADADVERAVPAEAEAEAVAVKTKLRLPSITAAQRAALRRLVQSSGDRETRETEALRGPRLSQ